MNLWREVGRLAYENGERRCRVVDAQGKKHPACNGKFEQAHHGCFPAEASKKTKEYRSFLDSPQNFCPACIPCNVQNRVGDGDLARFEFFKLQVAKYGKTAMKVWMQKAPQPIQTRPLWARCWKEVS